jgi:hypothetical protein
METLSEYMLIARYPHQAILVQPEITHYKSVPTTVKEKIMNILKIIGLVFMGIFFIALVTVAVWGLIQWPWMIIFLIAGLLVGR